MLEEITLLSFFVHDSSSHYIESEVRPAPRRTWMTGPGYSEDGLPVGNLEIGAHLSSSSCRGPIGVSWHLTQPAGWVFKPDSCTSRSLFLLVDLSFFQPPVVQHERV